MKDRFSRRLIQALTPGLVFVALFTAGCGTQPQPAAEKEVNPTAPEELAKRRAQFVRGEPAIRIPQITLPTFRKWGVQETAADALARIGKDAVGPLTAALRDPNPQMRLNATRALARMGATAVDAVPALTQALRDSNEDVRQGAARALGQIGPEASAAIPDLIEAMRTPKEETQASASMPQTP